VCLGNDYKLVFFSYFMYCLQVYAAFNFNFILDDLIFNFLKIN